MNEPGPFDPRVREIELLDAEMFEVPRRFDGRDVRDQGLSGDRPFTLEGEIGDDR